MCHGLEQGIGVALSVGWEHEQVGHAHPALDEVLLLEPGEEGTVVRVAGESGQIRALLEGGATLPQAVMPQTAPEQAEQLGLFGE